MSNHLAIATVTAAIRRILKDIAVDSVEITVKPPDAMRSPTKDSLNIFLYRVTPNTDLRNLDLPPSNRKGEPIHKSQIALNLDYLLTAYTANDDELQAQRILASAILLLNQNGVLTKDLILRMIESENGILSKSDLADQIELIKLVLHPLSTEEMSKLWSSFFQTNYRLSVAFRATAVLLESEGEPKLTLPVRNHSLYVAPSRPIVIDNVEPQILEYNINAKLAINGKNLKAKKVIVKIANLPVEITPNKCTNSKIIVTIPENSTAGVKPVQVIHPIFDSPEPEQQGFESNVAAFMLAPKIIKVYPTSISPGKDLNLDFEPAINPDQKVFIIVGDYPFAVEQRDPKSAPIKKLSITIPKDFSPKTYLVRMRVDGVESYPEIDSYPNSNAYGRYVRPRITVN